MVPADWDLEAACSIDMDVDKSNLPGISGVSKV